jgi:hypothetical protein
MLMLVYGLLAAVAAAMPLIEVHQSEPALLPKLETKRQFTSQYPNPCLKLPTAKPW